MPIPRCGLGFDVHAFADGRPLVLGGVTVPYPQGLAGHSDADVLTHAVIDALLGAAGLGDIGLHFPDSDARWKGADSLHLLAAVRDMLTAGDCEVIHIDTVLMAQKPRVGPYRSAMQRNLAEALGVPADRINIKATTTEGLGFVGRVEGIAAQAVATVVRKGTP